MIFKTSDIAWVLLNFKRNYLIKHNNKNFFVYVGETDNI